MPAPPRGSSQEGDFTKSRTAFSTGAGQRPVPQLLPEAELLHLARGCAREVGYLVDRLRPLLLGEAGGRKVHAYLLERRDRHAVAHADDRGGPFPEPPV